MHPGENGDGRRTGCSDGCIQSSVRSHALDEALTKQACNNLMAIAITRFCKVGPGKSMPVITEMLFRGYFGAHSYWETIRPALEMA